MDTLTKIKEIERLNNNTPDGQIVDADTLLVDLFIDADFEISGIAQEIFNIWKNSTDKTAVEEMFNIFTDTKFSEYLNMCINRITRK